MGYIHDEKTGIIRKDLWTPKHDEKYYFINSDMIVTHIICDNTSFICQDHIKVFNCFKTEQEAETIRDKFLQLLSER